ncbi:lysine-specific demethylase 4B [Panicum miliaceum]|uniref:Lysine-specific demethylase 4B n=1 Tax=Panicum miliaceum TaxID=4540 RepID=A0A3L6R4Z1_PANMI|nr:lysine-specific demethylase 4B [Panicum miliaceum]
MEIAENGIASGSVRERDLPPSKRFKYVGAQLGSAPCVLLPAKKRMFPPPPPEDAAVSVCLPVKKRAAVARPPEAEAAAVPFCLPAKKRAIVATPPEDAALVCLPAKKRAYAPPADTVLAVCLPAKKCASAQPALDVVASTYERVHAPAPRDAAAGSAPVRLPANKRVCAAPPADTVASPGVVAKKRIHAPGPRQDAARSVPVGLPANKRVMPPPSVESDGPRFGTAKEARPQGSNKHGGGAIIPRVANGTEGCARGKDFKKPEEPINPKGTKEQVSMKPGKPRSPSKSKDLEKKSSKTVNGKQSGVFAEVREKSGKAADAKGVALKEESRNGPAEAADAEGRVRGKEFKKPEMPINPKGTKEQVSMKPSKPRSPNESKDLETKACKIVNGKQTEAGVEVRKKSDKVADAKGAALKELRNWDDEVVQEAVEEDDGVLCAVCASTDGDSSDPIVFCDGCDLMVHASCYGNPLAQAIPDGDWFCSLCTVKKSMPAARPSCCLCPARGGAMKRTTEGQWAHISCALLVPEVFFRDPDGRDGVDCSLVPAHRFAKDCYICESNNGCALECSQPKCALGFHVSCGLDASLCIEYREGKGGAIVAGFCREHTELWEKQQLTGKYKIVARGEE